MPQNRQKLTAADASVRSFLSDAAQVELNGHTVLMAQDAAGKTLLLGYTLPAAGPGATPALQEALAIASQTAPEISPRSTTMALVMMIAASGMDMDGKLAIAEALLQHPQFESLVADIAAAFQSNAYFLDSLALYAELVAKIESMARELFDAYQARFVDAAPLVSLRALATAETKTFCDWLPDWLCRSPWNADEPWTWFGSASLVDVWNPPFMAASAKDPNLVAFANPAMVLYAAEGYDANGVYQQWGLVKRNSSAIDKAFNSGAAQTLLRLDQTWLSPATKHIEFKRYFFPFNTWNPPFFTHLGVPVVGMLNPSNLALSLVGLVSSRAQAVGNDLFTKLRGCTKTKILILNKEFW